MYVTGVGRIATERQRQIEVEGYSIDHDDEHTDGELAWAAACFLLTGKMTIEDDDFATRCWPWPEGFRSGSRVRNLERAGALIAAEIDRLARLGVDE